MVKRVFIENPRYGHRQSFKKPRSAKSTFIMVFVVFIITGIFSLLPDFHMDKILGIEYSWEFDMFQHGSYYVVLALVLFAIFPYQPPSVYFFALIFFVSFIFEVLQLWIPDRNFSLLDLTSNFLGILIGFTLYNFFKKTRAAWKDYKRYHR